MMRYFSLLLLTVLFNTSFAQIKDPALKAKSDSVDVRINKLVAVQDSLKKADTLQYWYKDGKVGISFSQSSFTNWAAGGINSLSLTSLVSLHANYKRGKNVWDNTIDMAYGLTQNAHSAPRKNEDRMELTTTYGRNAFRQWYYTGMLDAKTQFDNSYNYPDDSTIVSHFMAPAYFLASVGLEYKSKDKVFSFLISPLTAKTTVVNDQRLADQGAFGVDPAVKDSAGNITEKGKLVRYEAGAFIKLMLKKEILKNVFLDTKLELFTNYLDRPQNIDVNWELMLDMKINRYLSANLTTQMIYDHDIPVPFERTTNGVTENLTGPRLQFKEVFGLGLAVKF